MVTGNRHFHEHLNSLMFVVFYDVVVFVVFVFVVVVVVVLLDVIYFSVYSISGESIK